MFSRTQKMSLRRRISVVAWIVYSVGVVALLVVGHYTASCDAESWTDLGNGTYTVAIRTGDIGLVRQVVPTGDIKMSVCEVPEDWCPGTVHRRHYGDWIS